MSHIFTPEDQRPRVSTHICGKCRKPFEKGHRITQAFIFSNTGVNPQTLCGLGVYLEEEFELVHIDCTDPFLVKGLR